MANRRKYGTTTEAAIRECIAAGMTNKETAAKLNVSATMLATARSVLGIEAPNRLSIGGKVPGWWVPALANGASVEMIAKAEGKTKSAIHAALKREGLPTSRGAAAAQAAGLGKEPPLALAA